MLGRDLDDLSALVATTSPAATVPLFLPHLQGERAPLWDIRSRGVFARLDTGVGPAALARSVMEGVAFAARLAFAATERSGCLVADHLHLGGGGARADAWCQIRADAFGKVMRRVKVLDAGTLGAAIIAGVGAGALPSLAAAVDQLVAFDRDFEPDPGTRDYYDTKFGKYQDLYRDLKAFNATYSDAFV